MSTIFIHDPFTWFDTESDKKRLKNLERLVTERETQGHSFWDWINFCDYYGTVIKRVCELIAEGKIAVSSDVVDVAGLLMGSIEQAEDLSFKTDSPNVDVMREAQRELDAVENNILRVFFTEILYNLPFEENYSVPVASRINLINEDDFDSLGSFLVHVLKSGLIRFKTGHGFPGKFETFEEWVDILENIISDLEKAPTPMGKDALSQLVTNFSSLWD